MTEKWMNLDRLSDLDSDIYFSFSNKFGGIVKNVISDELEYSGKGNIKYHFPVDIADEKVFEAIEKSVKDNHDYLLDLIGKPENKVNYDIPDTWY